MNSKKILTNFILPVFITMTVLILFFRDISIKDIKINFLKIPSLYLFAFVVLSFLGTIFRAIKYHILLSRQLSFKEIFLITLVRNFSVDLLPARTASLALYSWLTKRKGISIEHGATSFIVSAFYDGLALSFMLAGLVFFLRTPMNPLAIYLGIGFIFSTSILIIFFSEAIIRAILNVKMMTGFPWIVKILTEIEHYLSQHKVHSERITVFVLSLAIRFIKYIFVFILFDGVVRIGFSIFSFSIFSFGLAGTELSSLLPIQGIGGFGTWELAFKFIFDMLKIPANNIQETGFVIHITTQVWEYFIGLLAFFYLFLKKDKETQNKQNQPS